MSSYNAPIRDMQFVMKELAGLDDVSALPGCEEATADVVDAILEEANKFASGVLAPLNWSGDQEGARWDDGEVRTASGWKNAYTQFAEAGWTALACEPEYGWSGFAEARFHRCDGNVEIGQHGVLPVPDADYWRYRGDQAVWD